MSQTDWSPVNLKQFISEFSAEQLVKHAPKILYSKKDKEHEAYNSLILFFFVAGGLLIYISASIFLMDSYFNLLVFSIVIAILIVLAVFFLLTYVKSNVYIKPLECWVEIYRDTTKQVENYYCIVFYPIFSGKCHPNEAKDIIYKLYQEEVLKSKIDITQIELYFKIDSKDHKKMIPIGYFFQNGEGKSFREEKINRNAWKFFPFEKSTGDNFIAIANWDHQYEWRNDLQIDFDKLNSYAPWVIQSWNLTSLKPLNEEYKEKINWKARYFDSSPKLKPWKGELDKQIYENQSAQKDLDAVEEAIQKVIGLDFEIKKIKQIREDLPSLKAYFRDLKL